ncbi:MAG: tRNA uridine-5-carboxymethylaminomethyl(34) synthesis GTPase MnmE [Gemmatimonas sp.]
MSKSVAVPRDGAADRATIFALASAPGAAGVAVWRVSGPAAADVFAALCRRSLPDARSMVRVRVHARATGEVIDDGLAVWFEGPASFTGEDVIELYLHGGRAIARAVTEALVSVPGTRAAAPGEFTRRALEAGKLDLTRVEALADLVAAETESQRRQARRQLEGALGSLYDGWKREILGILARFEAGIDFPDEDIPAAIFDETRPRIEALLSAMEKHLADDRRGERIRDGLRVAIVGAPNVGKSSLLNALAGRDVAIVSSRPGTTRDVVEVSLDLGGVPVVLADTAGLRDSADEIEAEGVRRARAWAGEADIVLAVHDATAANEPTNGNAIAVFNKADLVADARRGKTEGLWVSAKTGEGLGELLKAVRDRAADLAALPETAAITRVRHREGVQRAAAALRSALGLAEVELAGEYLRRAARALGVITGEIGVEDVLDVIFREFCIGK